MAQSFYKSKIREISAISLAGILALLFWITPGFEPANKLSGGPLMYLMIGIFVTLLIYLTVQGAPILTTNIDNPSAQNTDAMASTLPGIVAIFGVMASLFGFWPLSFFWMMVAFLVILVTLFDLIILGGIAAKVLYLTDQVKLLPK